MDDPFANFLQQLPDEQLFPLIFQSLRDRDRESIENFDQKYNIFLQEQPRKRVEFVIDTLSSDFHLSNEAIDLIYAYKNTCAMDDNNCNLPRDGTALVQVVKEQQEEEASNCNLPRDDPILVQVVKDLGEEDSSNLLSLIKVQTVELLPQHRVYITTENGREKFIIVRLINFY